MTTPPLIRDIQTTTMVRENSLSGSPCIVRATVCKLLQLCRAAAATGMHVHAHARPHNPWHCTTAGTVTSPLRATHT